MPTHMITSSNIYSWNLVGISYKTMLLVRIPKQISYANPLFEIVQSPELKKYPAKLSLISFTYFFSLLQFLVIAAFYERNPKNWQVTSAEEMFTILYIGITFKTKLLGIFLQYFSITTITYLEGQIAKVCYDTTQGNTSRPFCSKKMWFLSTLHQWIALAVCFPYGQ